MIRIFTLILFIPLLLKADLKNSFDISCVSPKYAYINGVFNKTSDENSISGLLIQKKLKITDKIAPIFNRSSGKKDLINAVKQKAKEYERNKKWYQPSQSILIKSLDYLVADNFKEVQKLMKDIQEDGSKILLFSHSQGNLYANELCLDLGRNAFVNIQIATPASEILCGNKYTSIHSDEMLKLVNLSKYIPDIIKNSTIQTLPPLKSNRNQIIKYLNTSFLDFKIHSVDNYMNNDPSLEKIKNDYELTIKEEFKTTNQIVKTEKYDISCDNIEHFIDKKLDFISKSGTPTPIKIAGTTEYLHGFYQIEKIGDKKYQLIKQKPFMFFDKLPSFLKSIIYFILGLFGLLLASLFLNVGAGVLKRDHEDRLREEEEWRKKHGYDK